MVRIMTIAVMAVLVLAGATLAQQARPGLKVDNAAQTNLASSIAAREGGNAPIRDSQGRSITDPMVLWAEHGRLFGISDAAKQLTVTRVGTDSLGYTHTTFAQVHEGVPVFSGVLRVHQDVYGNVISANGRFYSVSSVLNTTPIVSAADARAIALAMIGSEQATVEQLELVVVDPGWYGDAPIGAHLAYYIIAGDQNVPVRQAFFVDAHTGKTLDRWNMLYEARDREIYNGNAGSDLPGTLVRSEGAPPVSPSTTSPEVASDANAAYDYYGDVYGYYQRAFGRDSIDDNGMSMIATVNYSAPDECPNAFWNGQQMLFCLGLVSDDIVGHEMTHGITEHSAGLIYKNQPGQLNESFSDVFGELIDLFNGDAAFPGTPGGPPNWPQHQTGPGLDTPNTLRSSCSTLWQGVYSNGVRWLMGEGSSIGVIRDMWDPTCFYDPDRANSPRQTCSSYDEGGVHSGSGIPNHAFAILTDGTTFNGYTINGIGPIKSGAVWYRALTVYLTPASDFRDAYWALNQAATDLIGIYPKDPRTGLPSSSFFTAADAAEVDKALLATEMNTTGRCGSVTRIMDLDEPTTCSSQGVIFSEDFEQGFAAHGWTVAHDGGIMPNAYDWVVATATSSDPLPYDRPGAAAFCKDLANECYSPPPVTDESGRHSLISPKIILPVPLNFPTLSFAHYVESETGWDGGNVKISVNNGPWLILPLEAFFYNGYNLNLLATNLGSNNPMANEPAFSGASGGWGTSLAYLGNYAQAGDSIRLRFDFGKNQCNGWLGWYVDDVVIFDCSNSQDCNNNGIPDDVEVSGGAPPVVVVQQPPNQFDAVPCDADSPTILGPGSAAEDFVIAHSEQITSITIWGGYVPSGTSTFNYFTVNFHERGADGLPGAVLPGGSIGEVPFTAAKTGYRPAFFFIDAQSNFHYWRFDEWKVTLTFPTPVALPSGAYFVEVYNNTTGNSDAFLWETSEVFGNGDGIAMSATAPGATWSWLKGYGLSLEITTMPMGLDCNGNGVPDDCDLASQFSKDCNADGVPDECAPPLKVTSLGDVYVTVGGTSNPLMVDVQTSGIVLPLSYHWAVISGPSTAGLSDPNAISPTFTPPVGGDYQVRCTVTDAGSGLRQCSNYGDVIVHAKKLAVNVPSEAVTCVGRSTAPLGGNPTATGGTPPYFYAWSIVSGPGAFDTAEQGSADPTFAAATAGTYVAKVQVTDSALPPATATGNVTIIVGSPPTVVANADTTHPIILIGESYGLGGSPTVSGGTPPYTYVWSLPTNPSGGGTISDTAAANPTFKATVVGEYVVKVSVSDAVHCADDTQCTISVVATEPYTTVPVESSAESSTTPTSGICGAAAAPTGILVAGALLASGWYRRRRMRS